MDKSLKKQIANATKWSSVTEIISKMIVPVTNMILARLLDPSVFGIVATVNMVVSFCDMFATAGFQKYLVQHEYKTKQELYKGTTVAFWTNLGLSFVLWGILVVFRDPIASFVGNEGYGVPIAVAGLSLFLTAFSSIQTSLYRRIFDFKTLFINRLVSTIVPFVVTIPLAFFGFGYWSLIVGTISGYLAQAIILTVKSEWKPNLFYSFSLLKEMLSFSIWTLFETFALWASGWVDIFIVSNILGKYYTGLYKTGQGTVTGILTIVTSATTAVLFSSLSRVQNDDKQFTSVFFIFQKNVALLVVPLGVGLYMFRDIVTLILLGEKWMEASTFIGIWGLCTSLVATYGTFSREAYRAKGKPKIALVVQLLHLAFIIPICFFGVKSGFNTLIYARSFGSLQIIVLHLIFMKTVLKFDVFGMFKVTYPVIISSAVMGATAFLLRTYLDTYVNSIFLIPVCGIVYFAVVMLFSDYRITIIDFITNSKEKLLKKEK
ncbi:MAG: lipopolysaccharide biosynthesis protein [Clostridiales bacterium]|nr:lipopolysaccharide biosynthesis protein [Clostridiales bacterium]